MKLHHCLRLPAWRMSKFHWNLISILGSSLFPLLSLYLSLTLAIHFCSHFTRALLGAIITRRDKFDFLLDVITISIIHLAFKWDCKQIDGRYEINYLTTCKLSCENGIVLLLVEFNQCLYTVITTTADALTLNLKIWCNIWIVCVCLFSVILMVTNKMFVIDWHLLKCFIVPFTWIYIYLIDFQFSYMLYTVSIDRSYLHLMYKLPQNHHSFVQTMFTTFNINSI